MPKQSKQGDKW